VKTEKITPETAVVVVLEVVEPLEVNQETVVTVTMEVLEDSLVQTQCHPEDPKATVQALRLEVQEKHFINQALRLAV
tara:strand:- start:93 stop:323 length:231 start_codon:yes stop_codon:yes gene_type:complete